MINRKKTAGAQDSVEELVTALMAGERWDGLDLDHGLN